MILGLSSNRVGVLPRRILTELKQIHQLEIADMGLDDRIWAELDSLYQIRHFNFSHNEITTIKADIMAGFPSMLYFHGQHNRIRDVPRNAFKHQKEMLILMLSHNEITRVPKLAFCGENKSDQVCLDHTIYKLERLYLDHNNISLIDAESISGLELLKEMNISFNSIPYLPIGVFSRLRSLQILDISSNRIHSLGHNVFQDTHLLKYFNASRNFINDVPVLNSMVMLEQVDLSHNNITSLFGNTFEGLNNLSLVLLNNNQLKSLSYKLFKGCTNLRHLDLSVNNLHDLGDSMFSSTIELEAIDISHNDLSNIGTAFGHLSKLKFLSLSYNKLTKILRGLLPNSLEFLDLKHNQIHEISAYTFKAMHAIKLVDISNNRLETLDKNQVEVAYRLQAKPFFNIRYNNFICDCKLGWLKDYADGRLEDAVPLPNLQMTHGFMCRTPFSKWHTRIQSIDRSRFLCNYTNRCDPVTCVCCIFESCSCKSQCPDSCRCFVGDDTEHVHQVRCNSAQLSSIPIGIPEEATGLWMDGNAIEELPKHAFLALSMVTELYLNNSLIHTIQNNSFIGLKKVRRLYLQDNSISAIYERTFKGMDSLVEIYLQNNDIYQIEANALTVPPFLSRINLADNSISTISIHELCIFVNRSLSANKRAHLYLGGNQWTCDAEFSCQFLQFLLINSDSIQDINYIECVRPLIVDGTSHKKSRPMGRLVLDLQRDLCAENITTPHNMSRPSVENVRAEPEIYALIAACIIATFVIILVVICYLNRHFLQVFCFTRFGFRPFKMATDDEDYERPYDAFISYSNKDEDFVVRQLAPRLEKGDKKFKLCVHYRDFPVGACIAETIVRSVEASKRTILVVSQNFLDSEWCRFEFQTAHQQVLNERRNRVILVLLHDINTDKLDNTLKAYMRTRTYLKYDDAWFWEKLMFSMPDVRYRKYQQAHQPPVEEPAPRPSGGSVCGGNSFMDANFFVRDAAGRVSLLSQHQQHQLPTGTPRTLAGYNYNANPNVSSNTLTSMTSNASMVANIPPMVGVHNINHNHAHHAHLSQMSHPPPPQHPQHVPCTHLHHSLPSDAGSQQMSHDMYEIPVLDPQTGHYQLANGGVCCSPCSSHHHHHTNTAFQLNYSDTTSGYHNGSLGGSSSAHYEEVGPGHFVPHSHSTPHKHLIVDTPPPLPRIPQEGFVPRDKMTFV